MRKYETHLEAKVGERNFAHQTINQLWPTVVNALRPLVGQKILNQGFVKSEKFKKALPVFPNNPDVSVWVDADRYGIRLIVKTSGNYKDRDGEYHFSCYAEVYSSLAEMDGFILKAIVERPAAFRTDYTVAEVVEARKKIRAAEEALSKAQGELFPFEEYDQ